MAYVALYRKYRSQSFDELMGQEHVTTTLQNAIRSGRIAHAYLFHGARGCGKTSTARLLARALNCVAQDGPTPEPCGQCRLCVSIRDGACMDVIEMDAASETGIDDVREKIIENVQYVPGEARYKVYIIDEVHDLSAKAFDALLKTLEEPPAHVVFVLATTEQHKVPVTIRSRCQPYQFKRGTLQDLSSAVQRVMEAEGCSGEPEAIQSIARAAEGSWRDALSLLEQVLAYSDGQITAETVHRALGTVGLETLVRVTETLARGQWDETLAVAAELIDSGKDVRQMLTALNGHLRDLMLIAAGAKQAAAQELGADRLALLSPQAALFEPSTLLRMMGALSDAEKETRFTNQHRWLLERTLLRLMTLQQEADGEPAPTPRARQAAERTEIPVRREAVASPLAATPAIVPKPPLPSAMHVDAGAPVMERAEEDVEEDAVEEPDRLITLPETDEVETPLTAAPNPAVESAFAPAAEATTPESPVSSQTRNGTHAPAEEAGPALDAAPVSNEHRFADEITLEVIRRSWPRIIKLVEQVSKPAIGFLEKAEVAGLDGKMVILVFRDSFARDRIHNKGRDLVEKAINKGLKTEGYKVRCILTDQVENKEPGSTDKTAPSSPRASTDAAAPTAEMTLLDAPPTLVNTPVRIADYETSPLPAETSAYIHNGANSAAQAAPAAVATDAKQPEPEAAAETGLLAETLDIFGGEVITSEPL
jgi:DNA polymerase-3 subunit gamma/tau